MQVTRHIPEVNETLQIETMTSFQRRRRVHRLYFPGENGEKSGTTENKTIARPPGDEFSVVAASETPQVSVMLGIKEAGSVVERSAALAIP